MSLKDRLHKQLTSARAMSEKLFAHFRTPAQWTHQVHAKANHPLWFAGHMGWTDNFMISLLDKSRAVDAPEFAAKFGMGSQPVNDPGGYPGPEEVLAFMRERRGVLLELLDELAEEQLSQPLPSGKTDMFRDRASVFELAIWHEGLHAGQITVAHRSLGNPPVIDIGRIRQQEEGSRGEGSRE